MMACLFASQKCSDFTASAGETLKCDYVADKHSLALIFNCRTAWNGVFMMQPALFMLNFYTSLLMLNCNL